MKRLITILPLLLLIASCTGGQGPTGPEGPQGEPGPGTRIVYQSNTAIPTEGFYIVEVPELDTDDMPLVSVYISVPGDDFWLELPVYYDAGPPDGTACYLRDGEVVFYECAGLRYRIVLVI